MTEFCHRCRSKALAPRKCFGCGDALCAACYELVTLCLLCEDKADERSYVAEGDEE